MKKTNRFKFHRQDGQPGIADHKKLRFYPFESQESAAKALALILVPGNQFILKLAFDRLQPSATP